MLLCAAISEWRGTGRRLGGGPPAVSGGTSQQHRDLCEPDAQQLAARSEHRQRLVGPDAVHDADSDAPAAVAVHP